MDNVNPSIPEYCWATTAPAYCTGTSCICQGGQANPQTQGESYGVISLADCAFTEKYSGGKCWYQVPEIVIDWEYNPALEPESGVNVYVREEKVWFLDSKGYLIPAKVTITVW